MKGQITAQYDNSIMYIFIMSMIEFIHDKNDIQDLLEQSFNNCKNLYIDSSIPYIKFDNILSISQLNSTTVNILKERYLNSTINYSNVKLQDGPQRAVHMYDDNIMINMFISPYDHLPKNDLSYVTNYQNKSIVYQTSNNITLFKNLDKIDKYLTSNIFGLIFYIGLLCSATQVDYHILEEFNHVNNSNSSDTFNIAIQSLLNIEKLNRINFIDKLFYYKKNENYIQLNYREIFEYL